MEIVWRFLKKLKIGQVYDPAIPVHLKEFVSMHTIEILCIPTFTGVLFTAAKLWNQPRRPLTDERIKKMWLFISMYINTDMWVHRQIR
jgi:hypothetical protein